MQKIVQNEDFLLPATIDDPAILDEIDNAVELAGLKQV
jgi:propionyl-CoA synthetase